ncbi:MAG: cryptochrome/photolyase family protein [Halioglobus sp.]
MKDNDIKAPSLILVLGDQLTHNSGALKGALPDRDAIVMAEVRAEATYVRHNRHKLVYIFSAMRHFRDQLRALGFTVYYYPYEDGVASLHAAVTRALEASSSEQLRCCKPGEYRLLREMGEWDLPVPVALLEDDRYLATEADFAAWADGRKQLRMEYFYRLMRKKYNFLLDAEGKAAGGKWNFDAQNRKGWRAQQAIPQRPKQLVDAITAEVIDLVEAAFPDNPGDLSQFYLAVTADDAEKHLTWFVEHCLADFGTYQDALAEESPWLFHGLISVYLNTGLLCPLTVCRRVEEAYREELVPLAAAEGFIRQILGWREYVRGIYWHYMPDYAGLNGLQATRALPDWFWSGDTDMRCMQVALRQTLDLGYAHHIQRLMVIGNFALLAGLDVEQVCDWFLAVYVDAFEWVELPNTLGMALHGDGGIMASKPYAASGKYIQRQGNHCKQCIYDPKKVTGQGACPYNSLYWRFIDRHEPMLQANPRMTLITRNWQGRDQASRSSIVSWADTELQRLAPDGENL